MPDVVRGNAKQGASQSADTTSQIDKKSAFALTPLAAAVVAALHPVAPALAQDEAVRLEEIVVTATKRELDLQDVPHSIDVISEVDLERMAAMGLSDVVKALPSVALTEWQPGLNSLVMRGISTGSYEYRTDAQVAVYLDEQPLTTNSQQVSVRVIDMERIESLAGPQGTLFGSASQTGTIRYITNKPTSDNFSGEVEGRYATTKGGDDSYDLSGYLNIPIVEDRFGVRVVGYTSHEGGYVDNVLGTSFEGGYDNSNIARENINEFDTAGGRVAALWSISDKWSVLFGVAGESTEAVGTWQSDPFLGDYKVTRFIDEMRTDDWYSASISLQGDLGFASLSLTATSFDREIAYEWDNMAYSQDKDRWYGGGLYYELYNAGDPNYINYSNYPLYNTDYVRSSIFNDQEQTRDTVELRLMSQGDSRLQWVAGAYYEDTFDGWYYGSQFQDFVNTTSFNAANDVYAYYWGYFGFYDADCACYVPNPNQAYPLPPTDVGYSNTLRRSIAQVAVFGEVSYDITDQLTVLGGVRWAEYDRDTYSRFAFPEGLVPYDDRVSGDGSFRDIGKSDDTIYKVSLQYNIDDRRMIYGLYSQGFRLGGVNSPRAAATGQISQLYNPDYLDNYEFGIKSVWFDDRLKINADVFLMEWSDYQQAASFDAWWLRGTVNARTAETKGVEVQLDWQVSDKLLLSANLFAASPEFTSDWQNNFVNGVPVPDPGGDLTIRNGMPMPGSPERKAHLSLYYDAGDVFGGNLWFWYDFSYQSETWDRIDNIVDNNTDGLAPSSTFSNLSIGLDFPSDWSMALNVKNLFDETGYNYVNTFDNDSAELFGDQRMSNLRSLWRPRTVWLTLRKGFGR